MRADSIEDFDEDDDDIDYGDVNFRPEAILAAERAYAEEISYRIKDYKWSHSYFDMNGQRKFTITFALGQQLEFRVVIGTTLNIIIRSINLLPGGQVSLLDQKLMESVINILQKCHRDLLTSVLVPRRDVMKWRRDINKWKTDTFTYDIPENLLFQVPKNEVECIKLDITTRLIYQDRLTKAIVEVTGVNEDQGLLEERARAKLYIMRELREL